MFSQQVTSLSARHLVSLLMCNRSHSIKMMPSITYLVNSVRILSVCLSSCLISLLLHCQQSCPSCSWRQARLCPLTTCSMKSRSGLGIMMLMMSQMGFSYSMILLFALTPQNTKANCRSKLSLKANMLPMNFSVTCSSSMLSARIQTTPFSLTLAYCCGLSCFSSCRDLISDSKEIDELGCGYQNSFLSCVQMILMKLCFFSPRMELTLIQEMLRRCRRDQMKVVLPQPRGPERRREELLRRRFQMWEEWLREKEDQVRVDSIYIVGVDI